MKIYAIADMHLGFNKNVDKPMDIFGDGWENHEERLKSNWLAAVNEDDTVIVPGDLSWGLKLKEAMDDLRWIHELPGQKVLFKGNHDLWWSGIKKLNSLYDDMHFMQNTAYFPGGEGTDLAIAGSRGWLLPGTEEFTKHDVKIYDRELIRLRLSLEDATKRGAKHIIAAMHYPPAYVNMKRTEFTDMLEEFGVKLCVYGHLHGAASFGRGLKGRSGNIFYKLISLDYLSAKPALIYDEGIIYE